MAATLNVFFRPAAEAGQRLYLHHMPPAGLPVRGALVYVHPWAEEMNKSRRMVALAARALAADGWAVLQVDLLGCGDSSGDIADATWAAWTDDVVTAAQWLQQQHPGLPLWLWGLRSGALVCGAALPSLGASANLLLWQPVLQGKQVLQQFLRLKAAALLAQGGGKAILDAARADLAAGRHVEVAGYRLGPLLACGLEAAELKPPESGPGTTVGSSRSLIWIELSSQNQDAPTLAPAAQAALPRWRASGWHVTAHVVEGPAFWQTVEIEVAPPLIDVTRNALAMTQAPQAHPTVAV